MPAIMGGDWEIGMGGDEEMEVGGIAKLLSARSKNRACACKREAK